MSLMQVKYALAALVAAAFVLTPVAAMARPTTLYIKPGSTFEAFQADSTTCRAEGQAAYNAITSPQNPTNSPAVAAAGGFVQGLMAGKAFNKAYEACFTDRGYSLDTLSLEDEKAFKKTKKADRPAWIETYYTRRLTELVPAQNTASEPAPESSPEPPLEPDAAPTSDTIEGVPQA